MTTAVHLDETAFLAELQRGWQAAAILRLLLESIEENVENDTTLRALEAAADLAQAAADNLFDLYDRKDHGPAAGPNPGS